MPFFDSVRATQIVIAIVISEIERHRWSQSFHILLYSVYFRKLQKLIAREQAADAASVHRSLVGLALAGEMNLATSPPSFISVTSVGLGRTRTCSYQDDSVQMNSYIRADPFADMRGRVLVGCQPFGQLGEQRDGRVDLAPLALGGDAHQHFPQIGLRDEMVAAVALDMDAADDAIALQFLERGRDVRAGQAERRRRSSSASSGRSDR